MAFVPDSTQAGYLGPNDPLPPEPPYTTDNPWDDFLHDVIAGVTGLDNTLVRPRWQEEPPLRPDISVNWVAFGATSTTTDWNPAFIHIDTPNGGYDALQQHEEHTILCSFYGPQSEQYCSYLQRGLFIEQNIAALRANAVGLVSISGLTRAAELVKERFWPRVDVSVVLRREVRYNYNVKTILRAVGVINAQAPGKLPPISDDFDTGAPPGPTTEWDAGSTSWDTAAGGTVWDVVQ